MEKITSGLPSLYHYTFIPLTHPHPLKYNSNPNFHTLPSIISLHLYISISTYLYLYLYKITIDPVLLLFRFLLLLSLSLSLSYYLSYALTPFIITSLGFPFFLLFYRNRWFLNYTFSGWF